MNSHQYLIHVFYCALITMKKLDIGLEKLSLSINLQ